MEAVYTAAATSTGEGRNGHVVSSDGILDFDLATPKEMGGAGGLTNPEQLFAAGYSACFHSALKGQGKALGIPVEDSAVTAEVSIGKLEVGFGLAVSLTVELGGISEADAQRLVEAAHQVCPYSNATRGNIEVKLNVEVG